MENLNVHYQMLLGLNSSWSVDDVKLSVESRKVDITISYADTTYTCPECGELGLLHDYAPSRSWRHLDTMQFETILTASVPRCRCKKCGVKTISKSWTTGHTRFTLLFESFAVEVLQQCSSISSACELLRINWHTANEIMRRAVERGMERRKEVVIPYIGIDEKSFGKGHDYVTAMNDLLSGRVIEVVKDRTLEATEELMGTLTEDQQNGVEAIAMDFWPAFISTADECLPNAEVVHDKFHISKYLNEAVDKVRRWENKLLYKQDDKRLVGSKFYWLQNVENMSSKRKENFELLLEQNLKTGEAWAMKTLFRDFWSHTNRDEALEFFNAWIVSVEEIAAPPLIKVAKMLERHIERILNYFDNPISNGVSEGLNSKIQFIKSAARGVHTFKSYRNRILFYCGKLDMKPVIVY
ncbi:MAG: ISL3 family transposase [Candidatus Brocadiaceae bacterium]|nr:ISL3 family transposase [Candidatus Brocadiaceae bacterium]